MEEYQMLNAYDRGLRDGKAGRAPNATQFKCPAERAVYAEGYSVGRGLERIQREAA